MTVFRHPEAGVNVLFKHWKQPRIEAHGEFAGPKVPELLEEQKAR